MPDLRVFISSTFRDLQDEREHLVKKIFPEIRAICREKGIRFTEVDLRWGLTDEDVALGQVIRTCLEEVDKCRPYFIGITGDRYGYIPTYIDIQKDPLLMERHDWIEEAAIREMSISEMEAEYAVLGNTTTHSARSATSLVAPESTTVGGEHERARFYFRRTRATLEDMEHDEERVRLDAYQRRIRASGVAVEEFRDAVSLGEMVYDHLIEIIKRDFADVEPPSTLEEERMRHEAFALSRRRAYIANPKYIKRLGDHVASVDPPLVVYAESGSGKSSLFAYWADQYRRRNPDAFVIEHYVGIGAAATDHYAVIRHICLEIKERFGREEEVPSDPDALETALGQWFGYANHELGRDGSQQSSMIILLDGLNQLQGEARALKWIPDVITPRIRLLLSSTVEATLVEIRSRGWGEFGMQPLKEDEREGVVVRYLAEFHKSLSAEQIRSIATDYKCGHPLFLKTLLEELRLVGRHEDLQLLIDDYLSATGTEDLFQKMLSRIEEDHGARAVRDVLSLMWGSRTGLDETELSDITALSRLKLATMLAGFDYHIVRKEGRLTFFHDYLRRAISQRYAADERSRNRIHQRLASFFESQVPTERSTLERLSHYEQSGDYASMLQLLENPTLLQLMYKSRSPDSIYVCWARLREMGHDPETVYRESIERYSIDADVKQQIEALRNVSHLLGALGHNRAAIEMNKRMLDLATEEDPSFVASAECGLGLQLTKVGDMSEALEHLQRALQLYKQSNHSEGICRSLLPIGSVYLHRGDYERAMEYFEESLAIARQFKIQWVTTACILSIGVVNAHRGELDAALECFVQALSASEQTGNRFMMSNTLSNIANIHDRRGDYDRSIEANERSLSIARELGDRTNVGMRLANIGIVLVNLGDCQRALECFEQALTLAEVSDDRVGICFALTNTAEAQSGLGNFEEGLKSLERCRREIQDLDNPISKLDVLLASTLLYLAIQQLNDMPRYLTNYVRDATSETWQEILLREARRNAIECRDLSTALEDMTIGLKARFELVRMDIIEHDFDGAREQVGSIDALLAAAQNPQYRQRESAESLYWHWVIESTDPNCTDTAAQERARVKALEAFKALVSHSQNYVCRQRIEELEAAG